MILVLGNESRGITLNLNEYKIDSITIPRKGRHTESLNVAIAGSILISEISK
jgi:tRNA G18 (ribose-2'-O)-methylase SpoU